MPKFAFVVYKITFPNGKIYVGKDVGKNGHSLRYFGSWDNDIVEADFSKEELSSFILKKEIIFESDDQSKVNEMEHLLINYHRSNDPKIGYNRTGANKVARTK